MIVYDLKCGNAHVFEAWFGSSRDYDEQRARGLVNCPVCGDGAIAKAAMAPAIGSSSDAPAHGQIAPDAMKAAMAELATLQKKALANSEWVGGQFANRARAMHEGVEAHAPIHGQATAEEARSLVDDGVRVAPLPFPVVPPGASN